MWSIKGLQKRYRLLIIGYAGMFTIAFIIVMLIPLYLYTMEQNNFESIQHSIQRILNQPIEKQEELFQSLVQNNAMELLVVNEQGQQVFRTLPFEQLIDAKNVLNRKAISYETASQVVGDTGVYDIWFAVYHIKPTQYLGLWTFVFLTVILLLFIFMSITISYTFKLLLNPIQRLKKNIIKIQNYDFELVGEKEDTLNKELNFFIKDIQGQIEKTQNEYSSLEIELQRKNEELVNRSELVASLTHDLKVPISLAMLQLEKVMQGNISSEDSLKKTYQRLEEAVQEVNEIVRVMYTKNNLLNEVEVFDLVDLIDQVAGVFQPFLREKRISMEILVDEHVMIYSNRILIKQVLYNAFSNVASYGKENGELVISVDVLGSSVTVIIYNDADHLNEEQVKDVFKLFYRSNRTDVVGTGTGLYAIKRIVERMNGTCEFMNQDDGVALVLKFYESEQFKRAHDETN